MKNRVETLINLFVACLLLGLLVTNARSEIDKHTIAVWLFEEGKGNKVEDVSGNGHDGKLTGKPKWVGSKFGKGLSLPGDASGYVVVESSQKLKVKQLTIEALIMPTKPTGKWQGIICKQKATAQFIARHIYHFYIKDELPVPQWPHEDPIDPNAIEFIIESYFKHKYNIKEVLRDLFKSEYFKTEAIYNKRIKNPLFIGLNLIFLLLLFKSS